MLKWTNLHLKRVISSSFLNICIKSLKKTHTQDEVKFLVSIDWHFLQWRGEGGALKCQQEALLPNSQPLCSHSAVFHKQVPEHSDWLRHVVMWRGSLFKLVWEKCVCEKILPFFQHLLTNEIICSSYLLLHLVLVDIFMCSSPQQRQVVVYWH